uniref:Dishevelled segment polarity protein 1a n=1 Tax=Gouania willdenowi TaxID=441366 RepID=A0A8C5D5V8_GOUWI
MAETKIIYHIDEEETPYLVKLCVSPEKVTLADFKNVLNNRPVNSYKFFFKSMDQDFGVVKEEISDDNAKLPCFNGRVVSWVTKMGPNCSENMLSVLKASGDLLPVKFSETAVNYFISALLFLVRKKCLFAHITFFISLPSLLLLLHLRLSSSTEQSSSSQLMRRHKRRRRRHKVAKIDRSSSFSSITDSTMSLNIITVTLNMEKYNFLGISIVGQSNDRGDGGIYIGSIMKGGAVAADGRIEPGDMLLQVNDVNFENMSNDDAVRILREIVSKTGPISLTVAKCWDPSPRSYFTIPRAEPVRPIDPAAWISHTTALTGPYPHYEQFTVITVCCYVLLSSEFDDLPLSASKTDMATIVKVMQLPDSGLEIQDRMWLKITIANAVIGADVVDWLYSRVEGFKDRRDARKYASSLLKHGYLRHTVNKITFSEQCYYTFGDLCQNMASLNLNEGSSGGGSEQDTLAPLPPPSNPWPLGGQPFPYPFPSAPPIFPPGYSDPCHSFHSGSAGSQHSEGSRSSGSNPSAGKGRRSSPQEKPQRSTCSESEQGLRGGRRGDRSTSQMSHHSHAISSQSHARSSLSHRSHSLSQKNAPSFTYKHIPLPHHASSYGPPGLPPPYCLAHLAPKTSVSSSTPPGAPPGRELALIPPELTASRQSFQHAMGNPCEFFVDIM